MMNNKQHSPYPRAVVTMRDLSQQTVPPLPLQTCPPPRHSALCVVKWTGKQLPVSSSFILKQSQGGSEFQIWGFQLRPLPPLLNCLVSSPPPLAEGFSLISLSSVKHDCDVRHLPRPQILAVLLKGFDPKAQMQRQRRQTRSRAACGDSHSSSSQPVSLLYNPSKSCPLPSPVQGAQRLALGKQRQTPPDLSISLSLSYTHMHTHSRQV